MSPFGGETVLLIPGIWHLHLLAAVPQSMVRITRPNHSGVTPAYVGLGRFLFYVIRIA